MVKNICFVCLGNICRSPMAEYIMKDLAKKSNLNLNIISAGTSGYHDGEDMHIKTKNKLKENFILANDFFSKKLTQKMCDDSDFILVMDNSNFKDVKKQFKNIDNKIFKITDFVKELGYDEVPDPWYSGNFDETYDILSKACANFLKNLH